jgi:hypothetical protein
VCVRHLSRRIASAQFGHDLLLSRVSLNAYGLATADTSRLMAYVTPAEKTMVQL